MRDPMYLTETEIEDLRSEMREAISFMNEPLEARGAGAAQPDKPSVVAPRMKKPRPRPVFLWARQSLPTGAEVVSPRYRSTP